MPSHAIFTRFRSAVQVISLMLAAGGLAATASAEDKIEFNRDIRPILADNCFQCHGPDSASRKADLRLDRREAALEAASIVPGKPEDSELVRRIMSEDTDEMMPPPASHKQLKPEQKDLLRRWIAAGGEYQPHWSFIAPQRPALPAVKHDKWVRNPLDRFVLAKLEERGLDPAPEADRRTLARRLSLDLTGLPPTPADVEAFVNDVAPDAYEKLVERFLASPQWGEHRARYWLDSARYADTHGIHFDNMREMWSYRDWVINAFNANMPFDRFTIEQLAGDLLPGATLEQRIGSGFNRCNITSNEGGLIDEEYLVLYARDRTETTSQIWLGLTTGCAVCHDHKFDPISQKEFYELAAFFNNTTQAAKDGNIKDTPPIVVVPQPQDRPRWDALAIGSAAAKQQLAARKQTARADFDTWLTSAQPTSLAALIPGDGLQLHAPLSEGPGHALQCSMDGQPQTIAASDKLQWANGHVGAKAFKSQLASAIEIKSAGDFDKDQPFSCGAWVKAPKDAKTGAIVARMDEKQGHRGWDLWIEDGRVASHVIHNWQGDALKVVTKKPVKVGQWNHLFLTYDGSGKAAGLRLYVNGEPQETTIAVNSLKGSIRIDVPFKVGQRHNGARLDGMLIQDLRLYKRTLPAKEIEQLGRTTRAVWLAEKPAKDRTPVEKNELFDWWLPGMDKPYQQLAARSAAIEKDEADIKSRGTIAHVMNERAEPAMAHVLFRGEYDKRRDAVKPATPEALPAMSSELPRDRLGFAQWLLQPEHPLTARVTVNRCWQEVFGTGLVRTAGDYGTTGELPSHPELLDWMAVEFRESGWDVKRFYKLLVTSATYRQAALTTRPKLEKDPHNRLLSRGPRFRMDAEMVRDYALAASGLLTRKIGGPSVKPYQPIGVWEAVAMIGSNTRDYKQDAGESLYRRSLYTFWKRAAPPASMDIFNAPSREVCTVRRERTNTPLQALVTLNDPQFVEAARRLAEGALEKTASQPEGRLNWLAERLVARPLRSEELAVVQKSLAALRTYYDAHLPDAEKLVAVGESKRDAKLSATELAAWTMLANELMNLDEVLNK